jgi:hypothetical protein
MNPAPTMLSYKASLSISEGAISIDETEGGQYLIDPVRDAYRRHARLVMDTRDKAVREALIKLGWTPPPDSRTAALGASCGAPAANAREQGAVAGDACLDKAERQDFDGKGAGDFMLRYLAEHGKASGEILVAAAKLAGFRPHDDRAFGPVIAGLAHRGAIVQVGDCARERGNGTSGGRIWALSHA